MCYITPYTRTKKEQRDTTCYFIFTFRRRFWLLPPVILLLFVKVNMVRMGKEDYGIRVCVCIGMCGWRSLQRVTQKSVFIVISGRCLEFSHFFVTVIFEYSQHYSICANLYGVSNTKLILMTRICVSATHNTYRNAIFYFLLNIRM